MDVVVEEVAAQQGDHRGVATPASPEVDEQDVGVGQQVHRRRRGVATPPGRVEQPEVEEADVAGETFDARDAEGVELHLRPVGRLVEELALALDQLVAAVLEPQVQVGVGGLEVDRDGRGEGFVVEAGVGAAGDLLGQDGHHLLADVGEHVVLGDERAEAFDARVGRARHGGETYWHDGRWRGHGRGGRAARHEGEQAATGRVLAAPRPLRCRR